MKGSIDNEKMAALGSQVEMVAARYRDVRLFQGTVLSLFDWRNVASRGVDDFF